MTEPTPKERLEAIHKEIEALEKERTDIYRWSIHAPESQKVCEDFIAEMCAEVDPGGHLTYPITVTGITSGGKTLEPDNRTGKLVAIRPCDKACEGKTYLGVYLGDLALSVGARFNRKVGVLEMFPSFHNPAIFVPDLNRVVMGCESWWGVIKSADDMLQITDAKIDNIFYVKAMKAFLAGDGETAKAEILAGINARKDQFDPEGDAP